MIYRLIALALVTASPALAQPIIIPLEPQPSRERTEPPMASAPPIAPPIAGPSAPGRAIVRDAGPGQGEVADQPQERVPPR